MNFLESIYDSASVFEPRVFQAGISEASPIPGPPRQGAGEVPAESLQAPGGCP